MLSATGKQTASIAGIALAVTWPVIFSHRPFASLAELVEDRFPELGHTVLSWVLILAIVAILAFLAFGGVGWRDLGAMLVAWMETYALIIIARVLVEHFTAPASSQADDAGDSNRLPLAVGLAGAIVAGVAEEFIYRGFLIGEVGELLGNRWLTGAFSVLAFTFAHVYSVGFGWSMELLYPALAGSVLTFLYFWRRNLLICMLMHAGIDAVHAFAHRS
jgi:membrane protease YdiL (CAAX protease family)